MDYYVSCIIIVICLLTLIARPAFGQEGSAPVILSESSDAYILSNGIVTAHVDKSSGDLISFRYQDKEMLATMMGADGKPDLKADPPGANERGFGRFTDHQYGFWSHDAMGPRGSTPAIARVTIDPKTNGGQRAEVSIKGISNGRKMGTGPGSNAEGDFIADIDIRYTLERGVSGVYTTCIFDHPANYPATDITEARFCFKLNDFFDWMLVDAKRNKYYAKDDRQNKYNYTSNQFDHPAFGWASQSEGIGCFLINASMEYMSGGPTKVEFLCHRDTNPVAAPCILNYWRSSHYGGSAVSVAEGETWNKVIGPFLLYCNSTNDPQTAYQDAKNQQAKEAAQWPYPWLDNAAYSKASQRGTVKGQLLLSDAQMTNTKLSQLRVGLTHSHETQNKETPSEAQMNWQRDAKHYQFWVRGNEDGTFAISQVRPGSYTLRAFADGVLGEYAQANIVVAPGETIDLGTLQWQPIRKGRQLWEIGIPNRNSREFFKGDDYDHDGMQALYAELFPNDITYTIGKSDFRKDMYYQQVPHADPISLKAAEEYKGPRFRRPRVEGKATPWHIVFNMPNTPPQGKATLRLAISGTIAPHIDVALNNASVGQIPLGRGDSTFGGRNGIQGLWYERELSFSAKQMKTGENTLTLTVPAGSINAGVMYDYMRLELEESQ